MFGNTIEKKLKSLDVYKRMPKNISEGTLTGATS